MQCKEQRESQTCQRCKKLQTYVDKVEHKKEQEKEINANITPQTVDMTKGTTVNVNGNDLMAQALSKQA